MVTIQRAALLKPLQMISGVVERRQTLPYYRTFYDTTMKINYH